MSYKIKKVSKEELNEMLVKKDIPFLVKGKSLSEEQIAQLGIGLDLFNCKEELVRVGYIPASDSFDLSGSASYGIEDFYRDFLEEDFYKYYIEVEDTMSELTHKEVLEALLEGKVVSDKAGNFRRLNEQGMFTFTDGAGINDSDSLCNCIDFSCSFPVKQWYEDIPEEGIICFVWSEETTTNKRIDFVTEYDQSLNFPFVCKAQLNQQNAIPLTPEQVLLYNQLISSAHAL